MDDYGSKGLSHAKKLPFKGIVLEDVKKMRKNNRMIDLFRRR
jgi:hypothetical protein